MNRQNRSSFRSNGSLSSIRSVNRKEKCKDVCRKTIAFMCTQVGVGGLIVAYAIIGAVSFMSIETDSKLEHLTHYKEVKQMRDKYASELWELAEKNNAPDINETVWQTAMNVKLLDFQNYLVNMSKNGYNGHTATENWSFPAALMFCLSVFSMVGYGNLTPRTDWGKVCTIIYATFGIPLYILYFLNMGKVLAKTFRWLYRKLHECSQDPDGSLQNRKKIIVPSSACVWVILIYILLGAAIFSYLEVGWEFKNSIYFCVTSLCKIGIGDYVPGTAINRELKFFPFGSADPKSENHAKLIINFVYILFGMGLVAMCYQLAREDIRVKLKEISEDLELCLEDLRRRLAKCCSGKDQHDDFHE